MGFKYPVNENFFNKWSSDMAYVLGFIYADGSLEDSLYNRGKYLRISSTDQEIVTIIKTCLQAQHPIVVIQPNYQNQKKKYFLRVGSHKIYNSLLKLGLRPKKSLTMKMPIIPIHYLNHFIRGYFDGDGCASMEMEQTFAKRLRTSFTSGSKEFLEQLNSTMVAFALVSNHRVYSSHRSFQLSYSTKDSIFLFKFLYANLHKSLYLSRKFATFNQYFILRPDKVDLGVQKILNKA